MAREAEVAMAEGDFVKGLDCAQQAFRADPHNVDYGILYGYALFANDRSREAKDQLAQMAAAAPDRFLAQYFHGWILWRLGEYGDAIRPLKNALHLKEGYEEHVPDVLVLLARCCLKQNLPEGGRYLQALRAHRSFGREPETHNCLGMLQVGQGQYEAALQRFEEALRLDPGNPVILQNLAVLHDIYLKDPRQAMYYYRESLAQRIERRDPTNQADIRERLRQLARERRLRQ
jgi:tetratricopeptide (TPR) repeat protein